MGQVAIAKMSEQETYEMPRGPRPGLEAKQDFPALHQNVHGKPLVYLDNAATAQKPQAVLDAINQFYKNDNANIHRGMHSLSFRATNAYEHARKAVADFIGARPKEVMFTQNATAAINLVVQSWARQNLNAGDVILLTEMEHHSNLVPWQALAHEVGARLEFINVQSDGALDMTQAKELISKAKVFAFTHISNAIGTINPVADLLSIAKRHKVITLLDASQSVPHMLINVKDLDVDFLVFSGHKMCGPTGIGVLYGKQNLLKDMPPMISGGGTIKEVSLTRTTFADVPERFEGGTPNIAGAIGLGAAIEYLRSVGLDNIQSYVHELTSYAYKSISQIPQVKIYSPSDPADQSSIISFNLGDIHPHDVASILDEQGIAIRSGHHCAQPLMERLEAHSTARASFYFYNTKEDVDAFIAAIKKAVGVFRL